MLRKLTLTALVLFTFLAPASAQQLGSDDLAVIRPFVDDQTIAILRVDLRQIKLTAFKAQLIDPILISESERSETAAQFQAIDRWIEQIIGTGANRIFVVSRIPDLMSSQSQFDPEAAAIRATFIVVPKLGAGRSFDELSAALNDYKFSSDSRKNLQCRVLKDATVIAVPDLLDRLSHIEPTARPEFATALGIGARFPLSTAVVLPPIFTRAASEILLEPTADSKVTWGSVVGRGVRWIGIGFEPNPEKFKLHLVAQALSAEAAGALVSTIKQTIDLLAQPASGNQTLNLLLAAQLMSLVPEARGDQLVLELSGDRTVTLGLLAKQLYVGGMQSSWQTRSMNNLKLIGLALLNYEDKNTQLPDRAIRDKSGKPLLSWRVAVLPEIEESPLYKQFHLDEPWDSEHNRKLIEQIPQTYRSNGETRLKPGHTRYLAAVGEHCGFPPDRGAKLAEMEDGTSRTILVVEAAPERAVIWTKPDDLEVNLDDVWQGLGSAFNAVFADGHVQRISNYVNPKYVRALFSRDGGEQVKP